MLASFLMRLNSQTPSISAAVAARVMLITDSVWPISNYLIENIPDCPNIEVSAESVTRTIVALDFGFFAFTWRLPADESTPVANTSHEPPPSREMLTSTRLTGPLTLHATSYFSPFVH